MNHLMLFEQYFEAEEYRLPEGWELTVEEMNRHQVNGLPSEEFPMLHAGDIVFHGTKEAYVRDIAERGFRLPTDMNRNYSGLTPVSISFYYERRPAEQWGPVMATVLPRVKLLVEGAETGAFMQQVERKYGRSLDSRALWTHEHLQEFGDYDGIMCKEKTGTEIRLYNPVLIASLKPFRFLPRLVIKDALEAGKYTEAVTTGRMTKQRAIDILTDARFEVPEELLALPA